MNDMNQISSYPLTWPAGWKRTKERKESSFKTGFATARERLFRELKLLGCPNWNVILSSNIPLRKDGLPYAGHANPSDPGFAVYFRLKDKPMVLACDQYRSVADNLYAIVKTIEALRGIQRWGASDMMERSFTGFQALPAAQNEWWQILGLSTPQVTQEEIRAAWKAKAFECHPDRGGSNEAMSKVNNAFLKGLEEVGL